MKIPLVVLALSLSILNIANAWGILNLVKKIVMAPVKVTTAVVEKAVVPAVTTTITAPAEVTTAVVEKAVVPVVTTTAKVVGDTTSVALKEGEKTTAGVVLPVIKGGINAGSKITHPLMVPVERATNLVVAPALLKFGVDPGVLKPIYDPLGYTGKAVAGVGQAGDHALLGLQTMSLGIGHLDGRMFLTGLGQTTGAGIEMGLNPALMETVNYATPIPWFSFESGMEKPEITVTTPKHQTSSEMVLFINGMATTREEALAEASALAEHLGRPVGLLYNLHTTELSDAAQALRDRTDMIWTLFAPSGDRTVRQLIYFLVNAPGNISLVSHSQGSLIVNAALRQAIRRNPSVEARIRWVGLGSPFVQVEVPYALNKKTFIHHSGDPVTEALGGNALQDQSQHWKSGHAFQTYLPQVELADLW